MINPWVLLALGVAWLLSCGSAYLYGGHNQKNADKAAYGESLKAEIATAHAQGVEDMQIEAENEEQRAEVRTVFLDRVLTVERAVREKPANCSVSEPVFAGVLDAIRAANNPEKSAKSEPLPAVP